MGLPSICAIDRDEYLFVGDARRSSFVFAHVIHGECAEGPALATEDEIKTRLRQESELPVIATEPLGQFANVMVEHPSALRLIELALRQKGESTDTLEPIYLREPYITTASK
jgi:tRNA A37 threonylcarbamoyladenosine modification protein TsaB